MSESLQHLTVLKYVIFWHTKWEPMMELNYKILSKKEKRVSRKVKRDQLSFHLNSSKSYLRVLKWLLIMYKELHLIY